MIAIPFLFACSTPYRGRESVISTITILNPIAISGLEIRGITEEFRARGLVRDIQFAAAVTVQECITDVGRSGEYDWVIRFTDTKEEIICCLKN
jgi:hypothetical protein